VGGVSYIPVTIELVDMDTRGSYPSGVGMGANVTYGYNAGMKLLSSGENLLHPHLA
jgi:hypothetical protein